MRRFKLGQNSRARAKLGIDQGPSRVSIRRMKSNAKVDVKMDPITNKIPRKSVLASRIEEQVSGWRLDCRKN